MKKYKFEHLNGGIEIIDPTITIVGLSTGNPKISNIDFQTGKYSVDVILEVNNAKFGLTLTDVQSVSLNWSSGANNLNQQVLDRLEDYNVAEA